MICFVCECMSAAHMVGSAQITGSARKLFACGGLQDIADQAEGDNVLVVTHGDAVNSSVSRLMPWSVVYPVLHTGFTIAYRDQDEGMLNGPTPHGPTTRPLPQYFYLSTLHNISYTISIPYAISAPLQTQRYLNTLHSISTLTSIPYIISLPLPQYPTQSTSVPKYHLDPYHNSPVPVPYPTVSTALHLSGSS